MEAGSASRYSKGRIRKGAVFFLGPGADRAHPIYMLDQALRNGGPHGVQYEVDAFAPRQLRRGYEISVTGHQNDLPNLPLLLSGLFAVVGGEHYVLVGRLVIFASWLATIGVLVLIGRRHARSDLIAAVLVALLIAVICIVAIKSIGSKVSNGFNSVNTNLP